MYTTYSTLNAKRSVVYCICGRGGVKFATGKGLGLCKGLKINMVGHSWPKNELLFYLRD